ncbi:uncharacterized protein LOC143853001 [Tasmannia lanceolata]|uniref:uncharacterized protein LOC143853001 n=1 Tax=Tasmannia lanceolata TaxID=3420 RepID=UPI004062FE77
MGEAAKAKNGSESWGLGLLVLLLHDDKCVNKIKKNPFSKYTTNSTTTTSLINRAQSTLSICLLILIFTFLLFTLCTLDSPPTKPQIHLPRRWLSQNNTKTNLKTHKRNKFNNTLALQGMGTLFRRGNRAMNGLLVAHLTEDTQPSQLSFFLRLLHRSGLTAKSDIIFLFPFSSTSHLTTIIEQENDSFSKLLQLHHSKNTTDSSSITPFDPTHFIKRTNKTNGEPIWGQRNHKNYTGDSTSNEDGLSWGSVVGFDASELDPENSLSGFLNPVPIQLRRWACYQMLLGRVRRNFKHVMVVGVKDVILLRDPLTLIRNSSVNSLHLWLDHLNDESKRVLNSAVIMGGIRAVRGLSNALLNEIVRISMQRKNKAQINDSILLTRLVRNTSLLKEVKVTSEIFPNENLLVSSSFSKSFGYYSVIHNRDSNVNLTNILLREICSSPIGWSVYRDC